MDHFEVDKMHAAHRQLNVAIRLYFDADDPVAVVTDPDEKLRCSLDDVEGLIMSAAMNAGELDGDSPSGLVFKLWSLAKWRSIFEPNYKPLSGAEQFFPGLAKMSRAEQRAFGAQRLREELSGAESAAAIPK